MESDNSKNSESSGRKIIGYGAGAIGFLVGKYSGINLIIPFVASGIVWWISKKVITSESRVILIPTFSIQLGYLVWLSLGMILSGEFAAVGLDVAVLAIGLVWLMAKPGLPPIIFLIVYQALSLCVNGFAFYEAAFNTPQHKALLIHVISRILAIATLIMSQTKLRELVAVKMANDS